MMSDVRTSLTGTHGLAVVLLYFVCFCGLLIGLLSLLLAGLSTAPVGLLVALLVTVFACLLLVRGGTIPIVLDAFCHLGMLV